MEALPTRLEDRLNRVDLLAHPVIVLTGCGHAGIVNIIRYAQRLTGIERVHAVFGGFHLNGPLFVPIVGPTVETLAELAPEVVVPAHCTGWDAAHAIATRLPDAFIQNSVGTRYELGIST